MVERRTAPGKIDIVTTGGGNAAAFARMTLGETAKAQAAYAAARKANPVQADRLKDEARILAVPGV